MTDTHSANIVGAGKKRKAKNNTNYFELKKINTFEQQHKDMNLHTNIQCILKHTTDTETIKRTHTYSNTTGHCILKNSNIHTVMHTYPLELFAANKRSKHVDTTHTYMCMQNIEPQHSP